jgi:hypothetical protein
MARLTRRRYLAAAGAAALAGCSTDGQGNYEPPDGGDQPSNRTGTTDSRTDSAGAETTTTDRPTQIDGQTVEPEAVDLPFPIADERRPLPMAPADLREEALSGGPPKDGIPSIDEPNFAGPDDVDFLEDGDPVFGVVKNGAVKAYPQKILVQHEIVNDTLGDLPVAVSYCPLTGTVQGFERGDTTFGVSGRLINNNLVMYDRDSGTWWPQILATSIPGDWNEDPEIQSLREFRLVWTTWEQWRELHPETDVLSTNTGHGQNYRDDPYGSYNPIGGYYTRESTLFPRLNPNDRYHPKEIFMGARTADGAVAFRKESLATAGLMTGELGGTPALAVFDPRLSTAYVYLNPDAQSFEYDDGTAVGTDGTAYNPDSLPLERVHAFDAMWFAWSGYYPEGNVYE